ncbi:MAG: hypothetical protein ACN6PR_02305 [Achromobacter sp.]
MKYAHEVIDLLAAYPGREFKMREILRHVSRGIPLAPASHEAMRRGTRRVLDHLLDAGHVQRCGGNTKSVAYAWSELGHALAENRPHLGPDLRQ